MQPPFSPPPDHVPLTDQDFETLDTLLAECSSPFDVDALSGLLHAAAMAPTMVMPSVWVPVVLPTQEEHPPERETLEACFDLALRFYNDVLSTFGTDVVLIPDPDEAEACQSFAEGFVAGAALDPGWRNDEDNWSLVYPFAYLAERRELLDAESIELIEDEYGPDVAENLCEHLDGIVAFVRQELHAAVGP